MNTRSIYRRIRTGLLCAVLALPAMAASKAPTDTLHVNVITPPNWNLFLSDRVSEDFTDALRGAFHRSGFTQDVEEARFADSPEKAPNLLTIHILEWRMSPTGHIDCTLVASLQTPRGTRELGRYSDTSLHWLGSGRYELRRSFAEAAEGALNALFKDVVRTEMLMNGPRRSA